LLKWLGSLKWRLPLIFKYKSNTLLGYHIRPVLMLFTGFSAVIMRFILMIRRFWPFGIILRMLQVFVLKICNSRATCARQLALRMPFVPVVQFRNFKLTEEKIRKKN
jgi:hypothetical protein